MDLRTEQIMDQLRKARSIAKGNVTRKANKVNELLTTCDNTESVTKIASELDDVLKQFKDTHEAYHNMLKEEQEINESTLYFDSVNELVTEHKAKINSWLQQPPSQLGQESLSQVLPEDSVSTAESRKTSSSRARSTTSSMRSSSSAKARAAAKKAALEAKAHALQRLHELQIEELKIQQMKSQVELRAEIAAAEAEKKSYEQSEKEETQSPSFKQNDLVQTQPLAVRSQSIAEVPVCDTNLSKQPTALQLSTEQDKLQPSHSPEKQGLDPNIPQWFPNNTKPNQYVSYTPDYNFQQQLMETQDRQNIALQQLVKQQQQSVMALTLPQPTMKIFKGDPTDYCDFIRSFEHLVEEKTLSSSARLYYLIQYTSGAVQDLMKGCLSMNPEQGYTEARRLLKERYGQTYKITAAYVQSLTEGPSIRSEDGNALVQLSTQLTSCTNTLKEIGSLGKLDHPENLKRIINRLPFGMKLKWRDAVDRIVEKEKRDVTIMDVTEFVTAKARAATHPIFGKIAHETRFKHDKQDENKGKRHSGFRANGFATQGDARNTNTEGTVKKNICPCKANHWLSRCDEFRKMSLEKRRAFVKENKLCLNCLTTGHYVRSCPKQSFCKIQGCAGKHSTFLHPKSTPNTEIKEGAPAHSNEQNREDESGPATNGYVKTSKKQSRPEVTSVTGLAIVPVRVKIKGSLQTVETYAFLDSGSNTSFCTEDLLEKLNSQGCKTNISLTTMLGEATPIECSVVELQIFDLDGQNQVEMPKVYSTPRLPIRKECIGNQEDVDRWPHLTGIKIPHIDAEIGLLVGSDAPEILQPLEIRMSENGGPFATRTLMGWVLNGPLGRNDVEVPTTNFVQADDALSRQFEEFCNYEFQDVNYDSKPSMSQNDKRALNVMENSARIVDGHYEIGLPWRNHPPRLSNNRVQAEQRLRSLRRRLEQNPPLLQKYKQFMDDLLVKDYARKVTSQEIGPLKTHWYLPHHPVFHPQKPEKVRVVFDCSAKYRNASLNDQLLQGPDLTNSLVGVLTRFREEPVAMIADIEAMFYQVRVPPNDCDALRFLWWPDGNLSEEPKEYEMRVHLFGGASSPSCANFALKKTARDNEADYSPRVIETVEKNFYVDDCLKSVSGEDEAVDLAKQLRELLARGGFKLTKWLSNSKKVMKSLPESERASILKDLDFNSWAIERALGVQWNISSDQFGFKIVIKDRPATRRGILSIVSSVYDPLGFVAPFIFQAKLILQELCRLKLGWDDEIPREFLERWQAWLEELPKLEQLTVNRCFKSTDLHEIKTTQLHHFADASQYGYGAVTYLKVEDKNGNSKCSFVMGKSRLAPIKPLTIPRMELSAAVVATKLEKITRQELTLPIDESFFWTDSTCVLRYVENEDKRFQTFVANRIATIHNVTSPSQWMYVNTELNPADDASRGVPADSLKRWIEGPEFLRQTNESWPKRPAAMNTNVDDTDPEVKGPIVFANEVSESFPLTAVIQRCSSWDRLKRIVAWCLRYKTKLREAVEKKRSGKSIENETRGHIVPVGVSEIKTAEREILKHVQEQCLKQERKRLSINDKTSCSKKSKELKRSSTILKLDPVMREGLLRVGGRLDRAPIDQNAKHPVILPKDHPIVTLIVNHYHRLSGHSGLEYTLSLIRQRFWIINGRQTVRIIINRCISCRKRQAPTAKQKMANLPEDRTTPSKPPFTFTGVDCFGPFEVKRGRITVKRYGVLFTCLSIRAIHLEVASSLDTGSFINALRRFIARRGQPEEIRSDNGGNFVKGAKELRMAIKEWNQSQIHDFLLQRDVKWTFNPPAGSHHGGVWERCIRTTRKVLNAIMNEQVLDDEGISTLMCEVEAIVNGRPITKLSDDPRDMEPLTPNHLLLLRAGPTVPPAVLSKQDIYGRRWRQVQYMADVFWRRWVKEYLPSLQMRQKWRKQHRNFAVGDVVLILDDKTPRSSWPLGRVLEVHANSNDGLVRSVKLKTRSSELIRPITKIVLLEEADIHQNDK